MMMACLILLFVGLIAGFVVGVNILAQDPTVYGKIFTEDCFKTIRPWIRKKK